MAETKNKSKNMEDELSARKKELQQELDHMQDDLGDVFSDLRENLNEKMNIWYWIKRYPAGALGVSFLVGLVAGKRNSRLSASETFTNTLISELRRAATQKAVKAIVKQLEEGDPDE